MSLENLSAAEWAQVASAAFAALAAFAAWATVRQNRRERVAAQTPELSFEVIEAVPSGGVKLHIANLGGSSETRQASNHRVSLSFARAEHPKSPATLPRESNGSASGQSPIEAAVIGRAPA